MAFLADLQRTRCEFGYLDQKRRLQLLSFRLQVDEPIFPQTTFSDQLVSCKLLKNSSHPSILKRKTAHIHFACTHRSGQKKSAVSGTSISCSWLQEEQTKFCVKSIFGDINLCAKRNCLASMDGILSTKVLISAGLLLPLTLIYDPFRSLLKDAFHHFL